MRCPTCIRPFTRKSYAIHLRYLAVKAELEGGSPAEHLKEIGMNNQEMIEFIWPEYAVLFEPAITKQQRLRMNSVEHRAGRA